MANPADLFAQINHAVLDLQAAGYQSYGRPVRTLAKLLAHPDLAAANAALTQCVNLDVFLEESRRSQGGMVGSAKLAWPDGKEEQLGLTLLLIAKFGEDPDFMASFGHTYFHSGAEIISGVREVTRQVIIPFVRDYKAYVMSQGRTKPRLVMPLSNKVFIVHGHDEGSREAVARFLAHIGFEPVILHERPNKGRTIITKFREEAADIGFAVVLMTPDDTGGKAGGEARPRARQNVVFELGFFIGALGPERVVALVKGEVERPSDFDGVVYIDLDGAGAWRMKLGQELQAVGFEIDWNRVMRG